MFSCEREGVLENNDSTDEAWMSVSAMLFDSGFKDSSILISSCMANEVREYNILNVFSERIEPLRIKTRSESGSSDWISYGKVCGMTSAVKFNKKMQELYGDKCYEMKAEAPDSDDCRMMYHRACK